jgi:site-specific DNA-methyltransferase (adenine-specific)
MGGFVLQSQELILGDCLDVLPKISDKSVDIVLTDPPYGTTACKWDSIIPFEPMWNELKRIIKDNGCIALFGSEPFSSALRMSNIKQFKYDWIWQKTTAGNIALANKQPLKYHEIISIFCKNQLNYYKQLIPRDELGKKRLRNKNNPIRFKGNNITNSNKSKNYDINKYNENFKNPSTILKFKINRGKLHPTQKPVALLEYLIKTYTNENDTVLDFTMGSGSTGVACKNLNRKFIGIEKDQNYFNIAKDRIEGVLI